MLIPTTHTQFIALLGNPLGFSKASVMQNTALRAAGLDILYFPLECQQEDLPVLLPAFRRMPFAGLAITKPFKVKILSYLDEIEPSAKQIGSCNTVRLHDGRLTGYNTDGYGFTDALHKHYGDFQGKTMLVCGAGGTARAICFACAAQGIGRIRIVNRSLQNAQALAEGLNQQGIDAEAYPLADAEKLLPDTNILVNATGLGMQPYEGQSPLPDIILPPHLFVCDLAYNPPRTKLLLDAEQAGCRVMNGFDMSVYQGARQFWLLTGKQPPLEIMFETMQKQ